MSVITTRKDDGVLVVISNNPPVNALGVAVRSGLADAIRQATDDGGVKAVVIRGEGRCQALRGRPGAAQLRLPDGVTP
jgi:3-hydroxyacyl-CoA dehydrogenase